MKLYIKAEVYNELIEKGYGKRDFSKLTRKVITDKNGHRRTVFVKNEVQKPKKVSSNSFWIEDKKRGVKIANHPAVKNAYDILNELEENGLGKITDIQSDEFSFEGKDFRIDSRYGNGEEHFAVELKEPLDKNPILERMNEDSGGEKYQTKHIIVSYNNKDEAKNKLVYWLTGKNTEKKQESLSKEEINKKLDDFVNSLQIKDFWVQDSQFSWPPVTKEEKFEKYLGNIKESVNRLKTYTPKLNENLGAILQEFKNIADKNELRADKANEFITNIQHPIVKEFLKQFKKGQTVKISIAGFRDIPEWKIEDINGGAVTLRGITDKEGEEIVNMKYRSPFDDGTRWKEGKALKVYPKGGPKITSTGISFLEGFKTGRI